MAFDFSSLHFGHELWLLNFVAIGRSVGWKVMQGLDKANQGWNWSEMLCGDEIQLEESTFCTVVQFMSRMSCCVIWGQADVNRALLCNGAAG